LDTSERNLLFYIEGYGGRWQRLARYSVNMEEQSLSMFIDTSEEKLMNCNHGRKRADID